MNKNIHYNIKGPLYISNSVHRVSKSYSCNRQGKNWNIMHVNVYVVSTWCKLYSCDVPAYLHNVHTFIYNRYLLSFPSSHEQNMFTDQRIVTKMCRYRKNNYKELQCLLKTITTIIRSRKFGVMMISNNDIL